MKQKKELSKLSKMELAPMSQNELTKVSGGLVWGVFAPCALAFTAGYAVGTIIYKTCLE